MTKDIPIIYSGPMVRAQLEGRKTMTRRIIEIDDRGPPPGWDRTFCFSCLTPPRSVELRGVDPDRGPLSRFMPIRYWVGDRLWVRESLRYDWKQKAWLFAADDASVETTCGRTLETPTPERWPRGVCPSIHMAREFSRLTNIITDVKIERLQDISEADAIAEGVEEVEPWEGVRRFKVYGSGGEQLACPYGAKISFSTLWDSINGAGAWDANPFVVAISFRVIKANIDSEQARAAA